jgi:hypothetical protein
MAKATRRTAAMIGLLLLAGCNVVPPLDCLAGAHRDGCQRDARGDYGYLYRSVLTPNGYFDPPVYYVAPQPAFASDPIQFGPKSQTTCSRLGNEMHCNTY